VPAVDKRGNSLEMPATVRLPPRACISKYFSDLSLVGPTECRKKKQRCDRQRPRCTPCANTQTVCGFNEKRAPRRLLNRSALKNIDTRLGTVPTYDIRSVCSNIILTDVVLGRIERRLQPAVSTDSTPEPESQDGESKPLYLQ
jgi:Fungal Zn(2)-Cys(6) binuclear cluster domain